MNYDIIYTWYEKQTLLLVLCVSDSFCYTHAFWLYVRLLQGYISAGCLNSLWLKPHDDYTNLSGTKSLSCFFNQFHFFAGTLKLQRLWIYAFKINSYYTFTPCKRLQKVKKRSIWSVEWVTHRWRFDGFHFPHGAWRRGAACVAADGRKRIMVSCL